MQRRDDAAMRAIHKEYACVLMAGLVFPANWRKQPGARGVRAENDVEPVERLHVGAEAAGPSSAIPGHRKTRPVLGGTRPASLESAAHCSNTTMCQSHPSPGGSLYLPPAPPLSLTGLNKGRSACHYRADRFLQRGNKHRHICVAKRTLRNKLKAP